MIIQTLISSGLTEREAKVYLALIELGLTTTGPISKKTRLPPSKIYSILERLIDKGLISYTIIKKTKNFHALNPENLMKELKEKEKDLNKIIPELKTKQTFPQNPQIAEVFEGFNSIKTMNEELINCLKKEEFYYAFTFEETYLTSENAKTFLHNIHQRLSLKKIDDRLIAPLSLKKEIKELYKDIPSIKIRFTNSHFPKGLVISKENIINATWGERPTAIKITSEQIAERYKEFFLEMWNLSK